MAAHWRSSSRVSKWLEDPHARADVDSACGAPTAPPLIFRERASSSRCPSVAPSRRPSTPSARSREKNECRAVAERRGKGKGEVHLHFHYHAEPARDYHAEPARGPPPRRPRYKIREVGTYNPEFSSDSESEGDGDDWDGPAWGDNTYGDIDPEDFRNFYETGILPPSRFSKASPPGRRSRTSRTSRTSRRGNPLALLVDSLRDLVDALRVF